MYIHIAFNIFFKMISAFPSNTKQKKWIEDIEQTHEAQASQSAVIPPYSPRPTRQPTGINIRFNMKSHRPEELSLASLI